MRSLNAIASIVILASTLAGFASAAPKLYFSEDSNSNGLFQLDPATGAATLVGLGASGVVNSTVGLTETGDPDLLYGSRFSGLLHIAADGSGSTTFGSTGMEAMAYDPQSGILYGAQNGAFFTVDPVTGARLASLAGPGRDVEGLAALDGKIYGLNSGAGTLRYYDPGTNTWTTVGGIGFDIDNIGLASDPLRKLLYFKGNASPNLYRLDPATATATLIGSTGISRGGGMGFVRLPSRPDVSVSGTGTSEVGAGVINATGAGQTALIKVSQSRKSASYEARFKLTALDEEDILKVSAVASRVSPTYTFKGRNVTAEVLAGTWQTEILNPSGSATLTARFLSRNLKGKAASLRLSATSFLKPGASDTAVVRIVVPRPRRPRVPGPTVPQPTRPASPRIPLNP